MSTTPAPASTTRTPAQRYAALAALADGLDVVRRHAAAEVLEQADAHDVKAFRTPWGAVNVVQKAAPFVIDRPALLEQTQASRPDEVVTTTTHTLTDAEVLELVREHRPDAIVETSAVRSSYLKYLETRLKAIGDVVFDEETGEVVEWATVGKPSAPYVSWPASTEQRAAKDYAAMLVEDGASGLIEGLALLLPSSADA